MVSLCCRAASSVAHGSQGLRLRDGKGVINDDNGRWLEPAFMQVYRALKPDSFLRELLRMEQGRPLLVGMVQGRILHCRAYRPHRVALQRKPRFVDGGQHNFAADRISPEWRQQACGVNPPRTPIKIGVAPLTRVRAFRPSRIPTIFRDFFLNRMKTRIRQEAVSGSAAITSELFRR